MALLTVRNLTKRFDGLDGQQRHRSGNPGGQPVRRHRPQWRRQDDVLQHGFRLPAADRRDDRVRRQRYHHHAPGQDRSHGPGAHVPARAAFQGHDGRRERRGGIPSRNHRRRGGRAFCVCPGSAARKPTFTRRPANCSTSSGSPIRPSRMPNCFPMASSVFLKSRARSRQSRGCCCLTSRPPA